MTRPVATDDASRVLVYAPVGRDAELTRDLLARAAIPCRVCASLAELGATFDAVGAGAILITEEALDDAGFVELAATLERQPAWSDVPILLFAGGPGAPVSARAVRTIDTLRNVTLLERPIRLAAAISSLRAALRSRARQYEVLELLIELRRARAEAESANRLKDEFLATLSHELRTPLNAILGWTSMLTRGMIDPSRMPRVFETLERNAQAQAQLIADVLDVSRIITGKLQLNPATIDVWEILARAVEAVRPAAAAKNIALELHGRPGWMMRGDPDRLQQVFWNLTSNAVKFTPADGRIDVTMDRDGSHITVTVADTGVGIAPGFVPFVFDRFRQADQSSTRAHGGLGLGLAIVKHLTELHGGTVAAESEGAGRGARFSVRLPADLLPIDRARPAADAAERQVSLAGRAVLVVDDDLSTREVVAAVLEAANATVTLADSAADAWSIVERQAPDLIIADLGMPGEDGFSFVRRVRGGAARDVPAIALSAYADAPSQAAARQAGFTAFLAKPARPDALLQLVEDVLRGRRPDTDG